MADLRSVIIKALQGNGLSDWIVKRIKQPTIQAIVNKCVYIEKINTRRFGYQEKDNYFDEEQGKMFHVEHYIEEIIFQISAFKQDGPQEDTSPTGSDVCDMLITYFNSTGGIVELSRMGYSCYPIFGRLRDIKFKGENRAWSIKPSFDMTLLVNQEIQEEIGYADSYDLTIKDY